MNNHKPCALVDSGGICLVLKVPRVEDCKCPFYASELRQCFKCGNVDLYPLIVQHNGNFEWACRSCAAILSPETNQNAASNSDLTQ